MQIQKRHPWSIAPSEAIEIQEKLRDEVIREDRVGSIKRVAGADVSYRRKDKVARAAVAVFSYPALEPLSHSFAKRTITFPYIPGLLSFREIPALFQAFSGLDIQPDLLICDGHGYAHPRRFGLACHLGLISNLPTIGVAKRKLIGEHGPVPNRRGAWVPLVDEGEIIGAVLRTREKVKPVYVSLGHRVSLETAVQLTISCLSRYRLPEPSRHAHRLSRHDIPQP
jgi:deoxyribonuclease V